MPSSKRETVEFGLSRHKTRKRRTPLPLWMEEKIGWVGVVVFALVIGLPFKLMGGSERTRPTALIEQSHLRIIYGPSKTYAHGSSNTLTEVYVMVKNDGPANADHVLVSIVIGPTSYAASGPIAIQNGKSEKFLISGNFPVSSRDATSATFVCWNCPSTPGPAPDSNEVAPWELEGAALTGKH